MQHAFLSRRLHLSQEMFTFKKLSLGAMTVGFQCTVPVVYPLVYLVSLFTVACNAIHATTTKSLATSVPESTTCRGCDQPTALNSHHACSCGTPMHAWCGESEVKGAEGHGCWRRCLGASTPQAPVGTKM